MQKKRILIFLTLGLLVVAATFTLYWRAKRNDMGEYHPPGKIERKIAARIDRCQSSQPCTIRLSELTDFDWDRVYSFPAGTSRQQIETTIHAPFPRDVDLVAWLVFVKDGQVVYAEEEAWHVEKAAVNGVTFDPELAERETQYPKDTQFTGARAPYEDGYLYSLKSMR